MRPVSSQGNTYGIYALTIVVLMVLVSTVTFLVHRIHAGSKASNNAASISSYCVGQTFSSGNSGHCVKDIQVLAGYMYAHLHELPSCKFTVPSVAYSVKTTGSYDSTDEGVVSVMQSWAQCYAKQEGFTTNVKTTGKVDKQTWGELCTYAYTDPLHSHTVDATDSIAAGKDAGCSALSL